MFLVGDFILSACGPVPYAIIVFIINSVLCIFSYRHRSLDPTGTAGTMIVGCITFGILGLGGWMTLMMFFITSSVLTHVVRPWSEKVAAGIQKKGGCRDYMQVIANGGPATVSAVLYGFTGNEIFVLIFGVAMAASNSDTWAGEVGIVSPSPPVLITKPWKAVPPGLSGGVTLLGTAASLIGSFVIALTWYFAFNDVYSGAALKTIICITFAGFCGSTADSILGATVQAHYWDTERDQITEHQSRNGKQFELVKGIAWMDNDLVNLSANFVAIAIACLLTR
jgi:uncharacterized protein (TIGR00297 family)